jgi:bifunctional DNA-binding transcriptional regulator/antitoxin component of YhaV-PrlF toxin-antitoxin module
MSGTKECRTTMATSVDERGRLYLPKEVRERYGERFRIVRLHDGIKLLPVPDDPVEDLAEALEPIKEATPADLSEAAEEEAMREITDDLR